MTQVRSARAAARRRALEVKAVRQAQAAAREEKVCVLLTRYYEARDLSARHQHDAATALSELQELLGSAAETAELCSLTAGAVRSMTAPLRPGAGDAAAATRPGEANMRPRGVGTAPGGPAGA